jgi:hypothetical protein
MQTYQKPAVILPPLRKQRGGYRGEVINVNLALSPSLFFKGSYRGISMEVCPGLPFVSIEGADPGGDFEGSVNFPPLSACGERVGSEVIQEVVS